jgi:flagellar biosynthesis chaperone FliJ
MENYLNALDELIKQGNNINNELDKCLDLQEQTIKEIQRTNKILDDLNVA